MRFYFERPREGTQAVFDKPGLYLLAGSRWLRVIPLAKPHKYNEKRDDVLFMLPNWLRTLGFCCDPDFTVGGRARPYLKRWWILPRNRWFGVYLHKFERSDDDRALHDHPWRNVSLLLRGSYIEEVPDTEQMPTPFTRVADLPRKRILRKPGRLVIRTRATASHRVELIDNKPVWTLFLTGKVERPWGFHCKHGWIPWQKFVGDDPGAIGKGCGEQVLNTHLRGE
jgi:hypothetical protein